MSSTTTHPAGVETKAAPLEVNDWNKLVEYVRFLCRGSEKKFKVCMIDEEQEEIRIENKDEFDTNVKYARDHGQKSLILTVYIDDVHKFDGIYHIQKSNAEASARQLTAFPADKLQNLRSNILVDKWYIPVKLDEALGICLMSAIQLAQEGRLDSNADAKQFVETIVPEAFRKLLTTQSVFSWPREIQSGIFDMIELLVDLVGTRIRNAPVPATLLTTLAMCFNPDTTFSQKHKDEQLPTSRVYKLNDEEFLRTSYTNPAGSFGWLRSLIQRFIAQDGLQNLRAQFDYIKNSSPTKTTTLEYNSLLKVFLKCHQCIEAQRFRLLFAGVIRQAIQYLLQTKKITSGSNEELTELNETLIEICFNYEMNDEVNEILEIPTAPKQDEASALPTSIAPLIVPLETMTISKKSKKKDTYEQLAENIRSLTVDNADVEPKHVKKQRTEEQSVMNLFSRLNATDCTTDDLLSSSEKRSLKRKHRREQQRHATKKESKRSTPTAAKTYDRSDPADILRFFAPMKVKIAALYDDLQTATCNGNLREVLKIEEKLKLLRPYSARFIADDNTPDGTSMEPGQVFRKGWVLLNDGSMSWSSDDIELINLTDGIKIVKSPVIPVTAPHGRVVITVDYMCAHEPGTYESKWILSYRQQTFGPMIWCSIQVDSSPSPKPIVDVKETFEVVNIPLPACFDLAKPYSSASSSNSVRSSLQFSRLNSTDTQTDSLINTSHDLGASDSDSLSTFTDSVSLPTLEQLDEMPLIALTPARQLSCEERQEQSLRANQSLDFVDTVVTNLFSVAKQAGSTAKAIFNTLQAVEETSAPVPQPQPPAEASASAPVIDEHFEHIEENENEHSVLSSDPAQTLIEMGFVNRQKNQRLLAENDGDLNKVIEALTADANDDSDWFNHRH